MPASENPVPPGQTSGEQSMVLEAQTRASGPSRLVRTAAVGSCVSRDLFGFLDPSLFSLGCYVARQSIITARKPPRDYRVELGALTSAFQRRVTDQALHGSMVDEIRRARPDLLLWDLTDERTGVFEMPDGSYLTRTVELDAAGQTRLIERHATRHIAFGSDEHFALFENAAAWLAREIRELGQGTVIALVAPPWAELLEDGTATPPSYGTNAREANEMYERYLRSAERATGAVTLSVPRTEATAAVEHRWGPAPFHYVDAVYRALASDVTSLVMPSLTTPRPLPGARECRDIGGLPLFYSHDRFDTARQTIVFVEQLGLDDVEGGAPWMRAATLTNGCTNRLFVNDPTTIVNPELRFGWGLGSTTTFGVTALLDLVRLLDGETDPRDRIYVGSGPSAFVATSLALLDGAGAVVVMNPDLGWRHQQSAWVEKALLAVPETSTDDHVYELERIAVADSSTRLIAAINLASSLGPDRLLQPTLSLLSGAHAAIDTRHSQMFMYRDPSQADAPLSGTRLDELLATAIAPLTANGGQA